MYQYFINMYTFFGTLCFYLKIGIIFSLCNIYLAYVDCIYYQGENVQFVF